MQNHPGTFRAFFATLAAAAFLALTLSSCAVTVALPNGSASSPSLPSKPELPASTERPSISDSASSSEASSSSTSSSSESQSSSTTSSSSSEVSSSSSSESAAPAPSPAKWSESGKILTGYTLPDNFSGPLVLPTDREYMISSTAFQGEDGITEITIPKNVTKVFAGAFQDCSGLVSVTIESSSTELGSGVFQGCKKLVSVHLPDGISAIPVSTFSNCESLQEIVLPESVQKIGNSAFENCFALEKITLPSYVKEIGDYAFQKTNLVRIDFPKGITSIGMKAFCQNQNLQYITFSEGTGAVKLDNGAFSYCTNLGTVILRGNITSLPAELFKYSEIGTLYIPETVHEIAMDAFDEDYPPNQIYFAGTQETWDSMFNECWWLEGLSVKCGESAPTPAVELFSSLLSIFL